MEEDAQATHTLPQIKVTDLWTTKTATKFHKVSQLCYLSRLNVTHQKHELAGWFWALQQNAICSKNFLFKTSGKRICFFSQNTALACIIARSDRSFTTQEENLTAYMKSLKQVFIRTCNAAATVLTYLGNWTKLRIRYSFICHILGTNSEEWD